MIDDLLHDLFGPHQLDLVSKSLKTLSNHGYVDAYPQIEQILTNGDIERVIKRGSIQGILKEQLVEILRENFIFVHENAPLAVINQLAYSLYDSTHNYEPTSVLNGTSLEVTPENEAVDAYLSLMKYLYDIEPFDLVDYIVLIDEDAPTTVKEILESKELPELITISPKYKERYLKLVGNRRSGVVYTYLEEGGVIGDRSAYSLTLMLEEMLDDLSTKELKFEAASLIAISCDEPTTEVFEQVATFLSTEAIVREGLVAHLKSVF